MADLEALTRIDPKTSASMTGVGQYSWRYTLPDNKAVKLGSGPADSDWVVPEDKMISAFHAKLEWNGKVLLVENRGVLPPQYPKEPTNPIWYRNQKVKRCEVRPGEWFIIGQTRFTLRDHQDESDQDCPVDGTLVQRQEERTRDELASLPFSNPTLLLKAMEQLPTYLKIVSDEAGLFKQMLKVALNAMPKCDAAAVVRVPPDCPVGDPRVTVLAQQVRNPASGNADEFVPSRKLVRRVVCREGRDRKSILHVWSSDPSDYTKAGDSINMTLGAMHQQGATPWAICTPFLEHNSPYALYVSGRLTGGGRLDAKPDPGHLVEYQKFVEILVGLLETTRRTLRLTRQLAVTKEAWPMNVRKHLDDPERLESLLKPQEKDVTILFCDLRGYSARAEEQGDSLTSAWGEVQKALDNMSSAVTEKGGIVAGFRGDAVLGFWGWPEPHASQVELAGEAALRIFERMSGRMVGRRCGLGLTHGRALAGRLGAHDLAVVDLYGPIVNLAFRLEEMTKAFGVGIVVSDEIANRLQTADPSGRRWRLRSLGTVRPRGMKVPLVAYDLSPTNSVAGYSSWVTGENFDTNLPLWDEAVGLFTRGEWGDAKERFEDFFAEDSAAKCFLRFITKHKGVPPADWDGAWTPRPEE